MAGDEGSVFGKYFLLKKLASGGMGEIYLAKLKGPVGFEKLLVLKRILQHHLENQEFVDMFFAEARVAAQLSHSNIVQIYEMGEIEDCYYIAMEYVEGKSLRAVMDQVRAKGEYLHPAHAIDIIGKLCSGLSYAHNATNMAGEPIGVIHRDINPHNLLVSYMGDVKIIDFGIAKSQMSMHKTETGTIKGKFVYMSPEQSSASDLDKRSDIFSAGICAYEALSFINPFAKGNVVLSLDAIQRLVQPPLADINSQLKTLDPILAKALAKNRDERYQDCLEFRDAMMLLRGNGVIENPPESLADYMHRIFAEEIESEKKMIMATDLATTDQIKLMQRRQSHEHISGSDRLERARRRSSQIRRAEEFDEEFAVPHSRLPFFLAMISLMVLSMLSSAVVYRWARAKRPPVAPPKLVAVTTPTDNRPYVTPTNNTQNNPLTANNHQAKQTTDRTGRHSKTSGKTNPGKGSLKSNISDHRPDDETNPNTNKPQDADSFGNMQISTAPPVRIFRGGNMVGQTFRLENASGKLILGTGQDPTTDPFVVKISYQVQDKEITYKVDAEPWAIVRGEGGIGLGRTPLPPQTSTNRSVFDFVNPQEQRQLRVTLRFSR